MPIRATDYSKTIIYKLVCNDPDVIDLYVGHTTDFNSRKSKHKQACCNEKNVCYNQKKYTIMRGSGGWDNWNMVLVEKYPCADGLEARKREHYWYDILKSGLNTRRPYSTKEQAIEYKNDYNKKYYTENKERLNEQMKKYKEANAENILKNKKSYNEANAEKIRKYKKSYYEANAEHIKAYQTAYQKAYQEKKKANKNVVV
jgi:hypothetical protein